MTREQKAIHALNTIAYHLDESRRAIEKELDEVRALLLANTQEQSQIDTLPPLLFCPKCKEPSITEDVLSETHAGDTEQESHHYSCRCDKCIETHRIFTQKLPANPKACAECEGNGRVWYAGAAEEQDCPLCDGTGREVK